MTAHKAAQRVENADEIVFLLFNERRQSATFHEQLHLLDRRGQAATDDLQHHRIYSHERISRLFVLPSPRSWPTSVKLASRKHRSFLSLSLQGLCPKSRFCG